MSVAEKISNLRIDPLRSIEWTIAILTLIGGLYIFTPIYAVSVAQNGLTTFATALSHPLVILFWGAVLLVGACLVVIGLKRQIPQFKSIGWFSIILARVFQLLTTFLVTGFLPILWIYPLTITAVVVILWGLARVEVRQLASD